MEGSNRPGLVPDTIGMVSTQIEVDDLDVLSERGEIRLEVRVVPDSGAAVDQHDRRPLPHLVAIGHRALVHPRRTRVAFPLTSMYIAFSPLKTWQPPEHDVEHPRTAGSIERSKCHRRIVRIHWIDEECPVVEGQRFRFPVLALDEQAALSGRDFDPAVRPRIDASEARDVADRTS